MTALLFFL